MAISTGARALARAGIGVLAAWLVGAPAWADSPEEAQPAVWTARELDFTYMGFTTHYSCEGLRDEVRDVLLRLGARKDLKVYETGCTGRLGAPEPFPGVRIRMYVLTPAAPGQAEPAVPAHWKDIDVLVHKSPLEAAGQCELFEQIKQRILPLFTVRNLKYSAVCIPHQLSPGVQFKAQILVADSAGGAARG